RAAVRGHRLHPGAGGVPQSAGGGAPGRGDAALRGGADGRLPGVGPGPGAAAVGSAHAGTAGGALCQARDLGRSGNVLPGPVPAVDAERRPARRVVTDLAYSRPVARSTSGPSPRVT